jgi:hypothetical protein
MTEKKMVSYPIRPTCFPAIDSSPTERLIDATSTSPPCMLGGANTTIEQFVFTLGSSRPVTASEYEERALLT